MGCASQGAELLPPLSRRFWVLSNVPWWPEGNGRTKPAGDQRWWRHDGSPRPTRRGEQSASWCPHPAPQVMGDCWSQGCLQRAAASLGGKSPALLPIWKGPTSWGPHCGAAVGLTSQFSCSLWHHLPTSHMDAEVGLVYRTWQCGDCSAERSKAATRTLSCRQR